MIDYKILKKIVEIPSPSGFERQLNEFISLEIGYPNTEIDFHNNLIITIEGEDSNKQIILDSHADQLGFIVNNVNKEGMISLRPIGGHDIHLIRGRQAIVITEKGNINGVIDVKPIHLMNEYKEEMPKETTDMYLDLGIRKKDEVLKYISIGDPVVLKPRYDDLLENYVTGSGFDDKAGCFILLNIIEQILHSENKPQCNLKFVFSAQEEIGCFGSREVVKRYVPDLFIGIDVTHATDYPDVNEKESGECILGNGLAVYKGVNIYKPANNLLINTAKTNKIPIQYLATTGRGTNAGTVAHSCGGVKVLDLGIPIRNMHSPVEILNKEDLRSGVDLITKFLLDKKLKEII